MFYAKEQFFSSYLNHLIFPVCHSYRRPAPNKIRNVLTTLTLVVVGGSIGNGINTAISISKIKNSTATTKNCMEKGTRIVELLINPHSNALLLDFSVFFTAVTVLAIRARAIITVKLIICIERNFMIFLLFWPIGSRL